MRLGHVGTDAEEHPGSAELFKGICHGPGTERSRQTGDCRSVSGPGTVIDIISSYDRPEKFLHLVRIFIDTAGATDAGY